MWAMAVPSISSSKPRSKSGWGAVRSIPPNPSTVPIRVSSPITGSGTPAEEEGRLGHRREVLGPGVERHVEDGVPNCSTRCSSQARMAGHRWRVRGDT